MFPRGLAIITLDAVRRLGEAGVAPRILRAVIHLLNLSGRTSILVVRQKFRRSTARNPASDAHHYGGHDALHCYHLHLL